MKSLALFVIVLAIMLSCGVNSVVNAGLTSCTATTATFMTPQTYYASSSDCILRAELDTNHFGFVRVVLPSDPTTGDEYTLQEASATVNDGPYYDEELQEWVETQDYTGGVSFYDTIHQINVQDTGLTDEVVNATTGRYLKVVFDGTYWQLSQGTI